MTNSSSDERRLLKALKGEAQWPRPVWFMRQAGRYLPEYLSVRKDCGDFLSLCDNPEAAAEVTFQPIRRYGFDGSILFSDILTIPRALGQHLEFQVGEGPVLGERPSLAYMQDRLASGEAAGSLSPAYEAVKLLRSGLPNETTLLGFAGAPWTLATYMIEGGASKAYANTKALAYGDPDEFQALIDLLVTSVAEHLLAQIEAGADAVMVFDSWAGGLDANAQVRWSAAPLAAITKLIRAKHADVPILLFPRNAPFAARSLSGVAPFVTLQVDYSQDLAAALNLDFAAVQGNLDPGRLLGKSQQEIAEATQDVLNLVPKERSHVFNLGHGILKETDPEAVHWVLDAIRSA